MKFSVVTCTYNSANYIQKNIDSLKKQIYQNFEHIFIDGFSNDKTAEIIKEYQKQFPNKVFLYQVKANGISNAMNEGIKKAAGDFLIHLHADDSLFDKKVLDDVKNFLFGKKMDWIYGKINVVEENVNSVGTFPNRKIFQNDSSSPFAKYLLKFYNYIPHQAVFIKKEIFDKFGYFDETIKSSMDLDVWLRIKDKTRWCFYDRVISNYMIRNESQSAGLKRKRENINYYNQVQRRYLNFLELPLAKIVNLIIDKRNKNYR